MFRKLPLIFTVLFLLVPIAKADSLFTQEAESAGTLITERKARFEVGDIITVLVQESISANTSANTNTKKESDLQQNMPANQNTFIAGENGLNLIDPEKLPNWNVGAENEHRTTGQTRRTSTLTTTITCVVVETLPNDTLRIEGERKVSINREDTIMAMSGIIRAKDVTPANTIPSTQVASASVELKGKGPLWNNQRRGLITRFLDWFSPY